MNRTVIKKLFFVFIFFLSCTFSFAQNIKIIGTIPRADTGKMYQLQIGAYRLELNVNKAGDILSRNGFTAHYEKAGDLVRVFVVVGAAEVRAAVDMLSKAGFKEVVIREYSGSTTPEPKKSEDKLPPVEEDLLEEEIPEELEEIEEIEEVEEIEEIEEIEESEELEEIEEVEEIEDIEIDDDEFEEEDDDVFEEPVVMPFYDYEEPENELQHFYESWE